MPTIRLVTEIKAPVNVCFDLSRSIDLHLESTRHTGETAIAGKTSGLIELGECVTWRAKHLGVRQTLTSKVTEMNGPYFFVDVMVQGAFKWFRHEHYFAKSETGTTVMTDVFTFESPLWILGQIVNALFLTRYMRNLLLKRNTVIKHYAELQAKANKA